MARIQALAGDPVMILTEEGVTGPYHTPDVQRRLIEKGEYSDSIWDICCDFDGLKVCFLSCICPCVAVYWSLERVGRVSTPVGFFDKSKYLIAFAALSLYYVVGQAVLPKAINPDFMCTKVPVHRGLHRHFAQEQDSEQGAYGQPLATLPADGAAGAGGAGGAGSAGGMPLWASRGGAGSGVTFCPEACGNAGGSGESSLPVDRSSRKVSFVHSVEDAFADDSVEWSEFEANHYDESTEANGADDPSSPRAHVSPFSSPDSFVWVGPAAVSREVSDMPPRRGTKASTWSAMAAVPEVPAWGHLPLSAELDWGIRSFQGCVQAARRMETQFGALQAENLVLREAARRMETQLGALQAENFLLREELAFKPAGAAREKKHALTQAHSLEPLLPHVPSTVGAEEPRDSRGPGRLPALHPPPGGGGGREAGDESSYAGVLPASLGSDQDCKSHGRQPRRCCPARF